MHSTDNESPLQSPQRRLLLQALGSAAVVGGLALSTRAAAQALQDNRDGILDVAIIGGGLAGLTSARDLLSAGCESFAVLEARDRVGGRTYNHDLGHGVVSEAGGQWIGPGQTAIADLARQLEVGTFPTYYQGKTVYLLDDTKVEEDVTDGPNSNTELVGKLNELARGVPSKAPWKAADAAALDKLSVGEWLVRQGISNQDQIGFNMSVSLTFGTTPAGMGLLHYLSMINSSDCSLEKLEGIKGGAQETRFVGGSQVLSLKMAQALGDKLKLSCPVRKIVGWDRDVVELHTDRGIIRARQVIAAVNPALCNQITFDPPLPAGRAQLQRLWPAHAPMRKTVHVYERPFWRDKGLNGQIIQVEGPLILAYDNSPPDGSLGVLSGFVRTGQLPHDPQAAQSTLSAIYAQALGDEALHPVQFHDQDWGKVDPWTLTCISPMPPGFWTQWGEHLNPATGRLIWSGTETADLWAGSMDGAVRAGHRAALEALQALVQDRRSA
ncbi:flavin monoamine oxidase family protein [Pseudomonas chlororaphis]|uniref:flavin monoamine oxidase family protein n=1 Tax=Pseudomonas chlororaphis TaxID=587753 RepID=UPI000F551B9E|nr:FAD-dependent oxidoreductase [Pseudomonas chlororaphis]AZC76024.1 Amine oxidase [flavin-containing] A [Pseudomonas chlororaphis subsp. piscium]AZD48548.1 Amine oxidase [flavin-containing] A [Pseudomonas chlororaphis subsp. aurantiaca]QLL10690.1 FAD-dependent oxidoreductase [Pseudomonas chlororaphis subsp. aurantiaca]